MSVSQTLRTSSINYADHINPTNICGDVINLTTQLFGNGAPDMNLGVIGNVYTDTSTGFQYQKHSGGWDPTIALGSFMVIPDPLTINQLNVNIIHGNTGENVNVDLGSAGSLFVGPSSTPNQISLNPDGTIITEATTASFIASNGTNQTAYAPTQTICNTNYVISGDSRIIMETNSGNIYVQPFNEVILNPQTGNVLVSAQIVSSANSPQYTSQNDTNSGFSAASAQCSMVVSNSQALIATSSDIVANLPVNITDGTNTNVIDPVSITSSSTLNVTAGSGALTVQALSGALFLESSGAVAVNAAAMNLSGCGTNGIIGLAGLNGSSAITDNEYLGVNPSGTLAFYKPYNVLIGSPYTAPLSNGTYPVDFNGMSGGFSQATYYDSSYIIKKVSVTMNINSGTFTFGGGTSSLQIGHYALNAAQTSFIVDYTLALNTSGSFWQQSSGDINIPVTGPINLAVQLVNSGTTAVGVPNSFTVQIFLQGN